MMEPIKHYGAKLVSRLNLKAILKSCFVFGLAALLIFSQADGALAARSGGRIGGGSFRAPSRTYSAPRTRAPAGGYGGGYGYGYGGGGFGFPFILPFVGFGGFGGLFGVFLTIALVNFVVRSFRSAGIGSEDYGDTYSANPTVSVARLQVGLLAQARELQEDLNRLATAADTSNSAGLSKVLQETTLSLLRHPEYWAYADAESDQTKLLAAEQAFNQLAIAERSKFIGETLSNVNAQIAQSQPKKNINSTGELAEAGLEAPGEYIVATILVASQNKLKLPNISAEDDVRKAINQIGAISSDQLMALEVFWTPQVSGETLTADELIAEYPNLKLV
ncbi:MAG: DUF1517 domain-containing protein [Cyanobacteria bacterium P01_D01_bin.105]